MKYGMLDSKVRITGVLDSKLRTTGVLDSKLGITVVLVKPISYLDSKLNGDYLTG